MSQPKPLTFQELILRLQQFWAERGCILQQPYDVEVGAGTMSPETFLRVLGPKPYSVAYVQPSRRPADGRYGDNPNRLYKHTQFQVITKPPIANVQEVYLESLAAIGIDLSRHDVKFEEDNWEAPTLNAWGVGWQVMLDGLEITQFTYFQQCGGEDLDPICAELTYGLERIAAFLQDVDSIYDIVWVRQPDGTEITYGEVRHQDELQFSIYNFELADISKAWQHLNEYEAECKTLIERRFLYSFDSNSVEISWNPFAIKTNTGHRVVPAGSRRIDNLPAYTVFAATPYVDESGAVQFVLEEQPDYVDSETTLIVATPSAGGGGGGGKVVTNPDSVPLAAYDLCLKCSHLFNLLDARGAISVTERVGVIARIRALAVGVAKAYLQQQKVSATTPSAVLGLGQIRQSA